MQDQTITTGYTNLDAVIGDLRPGKLTVLGGSTGTVPLKWFPWRRAFGDMDGSGPSAYPTRPPLRAA